ncbi:MAG TPA: ABC transporter substrate-binding protein [Caldilineae bacterium]|nr:ABC transporter substrate-binding protein [Caldilineae bacterium]
MSFRGFLSIGMMIVALVIAGCAPPATPVLQAPPAGAETPQMEKLTLGLGYIPSVQFAPFYVAQEKGYFAEEGLDVTFQHGFETDFIKLVGTGELRFAVASGEEVILARAQGLPLVYVMTWYNRFPVVVFALKETGIEQPKDLEGRRVGIPGLFGASFVAWKALVYAAGIDESKVTLESIGFTQAEAVSQGRVDAAIDYAVSGPVQLRLAGREVNVISVSDYIDLPSNGLVTNEATIAERPDLVQRVVRATLRGLQYTLEHPDEAFAISIKSVPEAGGENEPVNRAIFDTVLDEWRPPEGAPLGWTDPQRWKRAARFMREMGLIDVDVDVNALFTNRFVESP